MPGGGMITEQQKEGAFREEGSFFGSEDGDRNMEKNRKSREAEEQEAVFRWAAWAARRTPEMELLFHIPNGGQRFARDLIRRQA